MAKVFKALEEHPVSEDSLNILNDQELHQQLFPEESQVPVLVTPDYDYVHKELLKSGVTLKLLWEEYVDSCRRSGKPPYMYSQFCKLYQDYVNQHRLTMHIRHRPGDYLQNQIIFNPG
jgi:transposase